MDYNQDRHNSRRLFALSYLGGECVVCGSNENLEFDHIIPENKLFTIGPYLKGKLSNLILELDKCQLLCKPHHIEKTATDAAVKRTHGKGWMALRHKCSCNICFKFKNEYNARRREQRTGSSQKKIRVCGTYAMYKHGCRCDDCKSANNLYMKILKKKKKQGS